MDNTSLKHLPWNFDFLGCLPSLTHLELYCEWQEAKPIVASSMPHVMVSEMDARALAEHLVLVTYVSTIENRSVRRSSIWRRSVEGWRVMFHQGTRID